MGNTDGYTQNMQSHGSEAVLGLIQGKHLHTIINSKLRVTNLLRLPGQPGKLSLFRFSTAQGSLTCTTRSIGQTFHPHLRNNILSEFPDTSVTRKQSHHHHQSLNREGRWGTKDDFAVSFLHFSLFSNALGDLPNSRPVHSLTSSSQLFLCPPCRLPPFTVPCKMVLARPDERET